MYALPTMAWIFFRYLDCFSSLLELFSHTWALTTKHRCFYRLSLWNILSIFFLQKIILVSTLQIYYNSVYGNVKYPRCQTKQQSMVLTKPSLACCCHLGNRIFCCCSLHSYKTFLFFQLNSFTHSLCHCFCLYREKGDIRKEVVFPSCNHWLYSHQFLIFSTSGS
jgi:hypothetical protein